MKAFRLAVPALLVLVAMVTRGLGAQERDARDVASRALRLQDAGQWTDGERLLRDQLGQCTQSDDESQDCRVLVGDALGYLYQRQAQVDPDAAVRLRQAAAAYNTVLKEIPGDGPALHNLAAVYRSLGLDKELVDLLIGAMNRDPVGRPDYAVLLGDIYHEHKVWERALFLYRMAMDDNPDDEYARSRLVLVYQDLPTDSVASLFTQISTSADWETRFPQSAIDGYELVMQRTSGEIAEEACARWARLLAKTQLLTPSRLAGFESTPVGRDVAELRSFVSDARRLPGTASLWGTATGREAVGVVALALGLQRSSRGELTAAETYWRAGRVASPATSTLAASVSLELAALYYRQPTLDPDGRKFKSVEDALVSPTTDAALQADADEGQRFHSVLGLIYAERHNWGSSAQPKSAVFQLEHAITTAQVRDAADRSYQPLPQLKAVLASGYAATGLAVRAAESYVDAGAAYLDVDDIGTSREMLQKARGIPGIPAAPRLAALEALAQTRAQYATGATRLGPGVCDTAGTGATRQAQLAGLAIGFVNRQRFKLVADCSLSGPVVQPQDAARVLETATQGTITLTGIGDLMRLQRSQAVLRRQVKVPGEASHIDYGRPDRGRPGTVLPLSISGHAQRIYVTVSPEAMLGAQVAKRLGPEAASVRAEIARDSVALRGDTAATRIAAGRIQQIPGVNKVAFRQPAIGAQLGRVAFPQATTRTMVVPANALWVDTGIELRQGQGFTIGASGHWSNIGPPTQGPDGIPNSAYPGTLLPRANLAALVGKVANTVFVVGQSFNGSSPADGRLYLSINDVPGTFADNQGSLQVVITIH